MQKFNYHSHTYRCRHADLDMMDEEYVKEYIKVGFKKVAFTDHSPEKNVIDTRKKMRMDYSEKNDYMTKIHFLKEKYSGQIEIQSGYEVEYLPGEEANIMELKNESDKIILGQHFVYDDSKKNLLIIRKYDFLDDDLLRYANYIKKAMELRIPDIIAHPDLYLLNREGFGKIEEKVAHIICQAAEEYNIPLEINLNNIFIKTYYDGKVLNNQPIEEQKNKLKNVVYPCRDFWKIASGYNIRVLYGIDTHHRGQILLFNELVELANEIVGEDVINKLNFVEDI